MDSMPQLRTSGSASLAAARPLSWWPPPFCWLPWQARLPSAAWVLRTTDFHLAYGLDGDIFVADWDGRNPVRIADGLAGLGLRPDRVRQDTGERDPYGRQTGGIWLIDPPGTDVAGRST